jgi:hypothetical protein|tara:strand:+ start:159 stop:392 length:234 start_codon:yes stop_codon:yes gene_type:complete
MKKIQVTVPVNTDDGKKIVPIEAQVSDDTINHDGTEFHLVQHTGSGFRYLADSKTVGNLENSDLDQAMDDLAAEEGF